MLQLTLLAIGLLFAGLLFLLLRADGLALVAPKSTKRVGQAARTFCLDRCRTGGACPLGYPEHRVAECPLWRFVEADLPTITYGSPFAHVEAQS